MKSDPSGKTTIHIEFDNPVAAEHFAQWLCESGEQGYWDWMAYREESEEGNITAFFEYYSTKDASKDVDDDDRYGDFLEDNTIRAECRRLDDEDDSDDDADEFEDADTQR